MNNYTENFVFQQNCVPSSETKPRFRISTTTGFYIPHSFSFYSHTTHNHAIFILLFYFLLETLFPLLPDSGLRKMYPIFDEKKK